MSSALTLRSNSFGAGCCTSGNTLKATVLDSLSVARMWMVGGFFFFCVILTIIIGAVGPSAAFSTSWQVSAPYDITKGGAVPISLTLTGLSKWNQVTWVTIAINRPLTAAGEKVNPEQPYIFSMPWTLRSVTADGVFSNTNSSHVTRVFCPPQRDTCDAIVVFSQVLTGVSKYYCELEFQNPLLPWAGMQQVQPGVFFSVNQGFLNQKYTEFE